MGIYLYAHVHSTIIHDQRCEAAHVSPDQGTEKQNEVCTYSGILFSHKNDGDSDMCSSVDEPWRHFAKWTTQSQKGTHCVIPLTWGSQSTETHRRKVGQWLPGMGGQWGLSGQWAQSFYFDDERVLEMDGGDGCMRVNILNTTELYT